MRQTNSTTFYSLAVAAAGLLMVFASGCSSGDGSGSGNCASNEVEVQGYGCLKKCSSSNPCPGNQSCTPLSGSSQKVCFGDNTGPDAGPDTDDGPQDVVDDTDEKKDGGGGNGDDGGGNGDDGGMQDVEEDGGGPSNRPRSELSCLESFQCQQRKCFRPGAGSNCQTNQQRAMFGAAQTDYSALVQCIGPMGTCSNSCPGENCFDCIDSNCSDRVDYCLGRRQPRNFQTCGDASGCISFCVGQTETQSQLETCVGNTCPSLFQMGSAQAQKRVEYVECLNNNLGFGRGDDEGPDAGIGTNDAGMPVSTCSTQADANGNNNAQIDTEGEADEEADCLWNNCGTEITNCFGCR